MNPLLHLIKEQEKEFKEKLLGGEFTNPLTQSLSPARLEDFHRTSNIAILEKEIEGMKGKKFDLKKISAEVLMNEVKQLEAHNQALDEQISMLKESIKELQQ